MVDNFDIEVGYTCNNNCIHCVIKPNVMEMNRTQKVLDLTTSEIRGIFLLDDIRGAKTITLTGGEITIRPDFKEIINDLKTVLEQHNENPIIFLQTNGRKLTDKIEFLKETGLNFYYVIAFHSSNEVLHNKIVGNTKAGESPFLETLQAINKIKEVYKGLDGFGRIEMVLSRYNIKDIAQSVESFYEMGIKTIGISYPHLTGFDRIFNMKYVKDTGTEYPHFIEEPLGIGETLANKIGFGYSELSPVLEQIHSLMKEHPDLSVYLEEVPLCVMRDGTGKMLEYLPNLWFMCHQPGEKTKAVTSDRQIMDNFVEEFIKEHEQPKECRFCALRKECLGVWKEVAHIYRGQGLIPITKEENEVLIKSIQETV